MNGGESNTSGENVMTVDFVRAGGNDQLPDKTVEEIARRLVITKEVEQDIGVVRSVTAPEDKTKLWIQLDPVSNLPIGVPKFFSSDANAWVPVTTGTVAYVPPKQRKLSLAVPAAGSVQSQEFPDIGTSDYRVTITPTVHPGSSAPGSLPNGFGWALTGKTSNSITISFYGMPVGGLDFEVDIEERPTSV